MIRLLLVMPDANIHRVSLGKFKISFREAPLTLTTLAGLIPNEIECEVRIVDESIDGIPFDEDFELVGISTLTGTALRAYEIADAFRKKGSTVVLGGVHVTMRPDEAALHADAIVVGFAEETWPMLLKDFGSGEIKKRYSAKSSPELADLPEPRRELQNKRGYMIPNTVFATRGCRGKCEFCSVPAFPYGWHTRPVCDVVDEIRRIKTKMFAFNDVNLCEDRDYALELFKAIAPLKKNWGGLCTLGIVKDTELIDTMAKSGCIFLLTGFESVNDSSLRSISKRHNKSEEYKKTVEILHSYNITVQGCFIFGLDSDTNNVFEKTVELVDYLRIDIPRYAIFTPYPGTVAYSKLKETGRILHENWNCYDTRHVVFTPKHMTPMELQTGFEMAYSKTFSIKSVISRSMASPHLAVTMAGNLAYRLYLRRMRLQSSVLKKNHHSNEVFA